jgi:hypothetical protein
MIEMLANMMASINKVLWSLRWATSQDDVISFFETEYKKDAQCAYEHWLSTQRVDFKS